VTTDWAIILAGGEGSRLRSITSTAFPGRPKQYCSLVTNRTLLDETRARVALSIDPRRTMLAVTECHRPFYEVEARELPEELLVEQPLNRGTTMAMALALGRIRRLDSSAVVAVFPSDHYYDNIPAVQQALDIAFHGARRNPGRMFLLGSTPDAPEMEYGWIEPGGPLTNPFAGDRLLNVRQFIEKPAQMTASDLVHQGWLWNTFIIVGRLNAFLNALRLGVPFAGRFAALAAAAPDLDSERELAARAYRGAPMSGFCADVLTKWPSLCAVSRMIAAGWIDVGQPRRLEIARQHAGLRSQAAS
jgi:mannose-1-phosphate guanylyltransferase